MLYLPGILLSLLAGLGVEVSVAARRAGLQWTGVRAVAVWLATAVASLHAQAAILGPGWPVVARHDPGLPSLRRHAGGAPTSTTCRSGSRKGLYVIKSYAFGYYYFPAAVPPVSATALTLVSVDGRPSVTTRQSEPGAAPAPEPDRRVQLAIGLR